MSEKERGEAAPPKLRLGAAGEPRGPVRRNGGRLWLNPLPAGVGDIAGKGKSLAKAGWRDQKAGP